MIKYEGNGSITVDVGFGTITTTVGIYEDKPCLAIMHACQMREVGTPVDGNFTEGYIFDNDAIAVRLVFNSLEGIKNLKQHLEEAEMLWEKSNEGC